VAFSAGRHRHGTVSAAQAASWLLDLAQKTSSDRLQSVAFVAASAADSARITDRLTTMIRDRNVATDSRTRAIRWLGDAARREGRSADADELLRRLIRDPAKAAGSVSARSAIWMRPMRMTLF
jgi:hypothetical protein